MHPYSDVSFPPIFTPIFVPFLFFRKFVRHKKEIRRLLLHHIKTFFFFFRNMLQNHQDILNCLRRHQIADLTKFNFDTPSFLSAMGPSRDGVLIPADFGTSVIIRKRAHSTHYQVRKGTALWTGL